MFLIAAAIACCSFIDAVAAVVVASHNAVLQLQSKIKDAGTLAIFAIRTIPRLVLSHFLSALASQHG